MTEKIEVGSIVEGKVIRTKPFGAIILLPNKRQGLVHISHISSSFVQNINDYVHVDDIVKVKVLSIDEAGGKISLSMKEAADPASKKPTSESNHQNHSSGTTEYRHTKSSPIDASNSFEDKLKEWLKVSNERQAGLNKRNKRR